MTERLAIKDVAQRSGVAAGTIRMWEQRYGFPVPERTASGYRRYRSEDVEAIKRVVAYRDRGLSVPAAIEQALHTEGALDRPSLYAAAATADPAARPQLLRKSTMTAISRAIEHEALAHAASPVLFAAFQREAHYRAVEHRYRRLARHAQATTVFADFPALAEGAAGVVEVPIAEDDNLANEWALIVDAPGFAACLLAWEHPTRGSEEDDATADADRRFECLWTMNPAATRRAAEVAARLAGRLHVERGEHLAALLSERPLALDSPAPSLTALTNRMIGYLERR